MDLDIVIFRYFMLIPAFFLWSNSAYPQVEVFVKPAQGDKKDTLYENPHYVQVVVTGKGIEGRAFVLRLKKYTADGLKFTKVLFNGQEHEELKIYSNYMSFQFLTTRRDSVIRSWIKGKNFISDLLVLSVPSGKGIRTLGFSKTSEENKQKTLPILAFYPAENEKEYFSYLEENSGETLLNILQELEVAVFFILELEFF